MHHLLLLMLSIISISLADNGFQILNTLFCRHSGSCFRWENAVGLEYKGKFIWRNVNHISEELLLDNITEPVDLQCVSVVYIQ